MICRLRKCEENAYPRSVLASRIVKLVKGRHGYTVGRCKVSTIRNPDRAQKRTKGNHINKNSVQFHDQYRPYGLISAMKDARSSHAIELTGIIAWSLR